MNDEPIGKIDANPSDEPKEVNLDRSRPEQDESKVGEAENIADGNAFGYNDGVTDPSSNHETF